METAYGVQVAGGDIVRFFDTVWAWRFRLLPSRMKRRACIRVRSVLSVQQLSTTLTTSFNVLPAEDVATVAEVQLRDEAILGIDAI